jgi:DNA-binding XRE family transcriptional regulator
MIAVAVSRHRQQRRCEESEQCADQHANDKHSHRLPSRISSALARANASVISENEPHINDATIAGPDIAVSSQACSVRGSGVLLRCCCQGQRVIFTLVSLAQWNLLVKPAQVRMARAALNWSLADLAGAAGVHRNTISNFETGRYAGSRDALAAIREALEQAGIEFIPENSGGAGVRLRKGIAPQPSHGVAL